MQRITISVPDELAASLRRQARICRKSVSEVVREALVEHDAEGAAAPPLLPFVGIVAKGGYGSVEEMDADLAAHWPGDIKRGWAE